MYWRGLFGGMAVCTSMLSLMAGCERVNDRPPPPGVVHSWPARKIFAKMRDSDPEVRSEAASQMLHGVQTWVVTGFPPEAVPLLRQALHDPVFTIRRDAVVALGESRGWATAAVPDLIALVEDPRFGYRSGAAKALGMIGPSAYQGVPALIRATRDPDSWLRRCAATALGQIGTDTSGKVMTALTALLQDRDPDVRMRAGCALLRVDMKNPAAVRTLATLLRNRDHIVREWTAIRLRWSGAVAEPLVPALAAALRDKDGEVRREAARALSKLGLLAAPAAVQLTDALKDSRSDVRYNAAEALGKMGAAASAALPNLKQLADGDSDEDVRKVAATATVKLSSGGPS